MKMSLPLKLGIFVVALFGAVLAACLLWTPLRVRYYTSEFYSNDVNRISRSISVLWAYGSREKGEILKHIRKELEYGNDARKALVVDAILSLNELSIKILYEILPKEHDEAEFLSEMWPLYNDLVGGEMTPLHITAAGAGEKDGFVEAARLFIAKGADVNRKDMHGYTPLHWTAISNRAVMGKILIEKRANISVTDNSGLTALHHAACSGSKDMVALLIQKGADVNAKDEYGWKPLHYAAENSFEDIAALLLEGGANANLRDNIGRTPLHRAALKGSESVVELLIEQGSDVNGRDNGGWTPLDYAISSNNKEAVAFLHSRGGKTGEEIRRNTEDQVPGTEKENNK
jgi:ankyrin repeat protein